MTKRYNPAMHSVEHILNQTMVRLFNCGRCVNAHIEEKKSRIDFNFHRNITKEEIGEIERCVNDVIKADLNVTEKFLSRSAAEQQFNLSKVPDKSGDRIRIITIGDYDACPCSGSHVVSTRVIGSFRILSTSYSDNTLRLRFKLLSSLLL